MFSSIGSIFLAIVVLGVLIFIHELGHFGAARLLKIPVVEFALGFGPKLISFERNGTTYSLRALPLGGFCRFYGEDENLKDPRALNNQKAWRRFLAILAGPAMNLIAAYLLSVLLLTTIGVPGSTPSIADVTPGGPAALAGLQAGDVLLAVDGVDYVSIDEFIQAVQSTPTESLLLAYERDGIRLYKTIATKINPETGKRIIGISVTGAKGFFPLKTAISSAYTYNINVIKEMLGFFGGLFFRGEGAGDVTGPVGTINIISKTVRTGLDQVLNLMVLISINLGLVNLLPLPALDGGRLVFIGVELVRRKPINPDREAWVHFIGLIALLGIIVLFTFRDIAGLFAGGA